MVSSVFIVSSVLAGLFPICVVRRCIRLAGLGLILFPKNLRRYMLKVRFSAFFGIRGGIRWRLAKSVIVSLLMCII